MVDEKKSIHSDGTAAELLLYVEKNVRGRTQMVQCTLSDQEWIVQARMGKKYFIRFASYFSLKHLFTFSPNREEIEIAAYNFWKEDESRSADENWRMAEHKSVNDYIGRVTLNRSGVVTCLRCAHVRDQHMYKKSGNICKGNSGIACSCSQFISPFIEEAKEAYGTNPFIGAKVPTSTCIIMNWVPKSEFEGVIVSSIENKTPVVGKVGEYKLRWDFGASRHGVVVNASASDPDPENWPRYRGCHVVAKLKNENASQNSETWEIAHMDSEVIG